MNATQRPTCSIEGCGNRHFARGWCNKHYKRWRAHGDPLWEPSPRVCTVAGCDRVHRARGLCDRHYTAPSTCSVEGCEQPRVARGWCDKHRQRWRAYGDPLKTTSTPTGEPLAYYLAHRDDVTDECMIWPYGHCKGYGRLTMDGRDYRVPILACEHRWGPMPAAGMEAAHGRLRRCESTLCWNGDHLSWKTPAQNALDKYRDGTVLRGSKHPSAKLTENSIPAIRAEVAEGAALNAVGRKYGVSGSTVLSIAARRIWTHV